MLAAFLTEIESATNRFIHRHTLALLAIGLLIVGLAAVPVLSPVLTGVALVSLAATAMGARRRPELAFLQASVYALLYLVFFGAVASTEGMGLALRLADFAISGLFVLAHIPVLKQAVACEET